MKEGFKIFTQPFVSSGSPSDNGCMTLNGITFKWEESKCYSTRDFVCECTLIDCKYALSYFTYLLSNGTCVNTVNFSREFYFGE